MNFWILCKDPWSKVSLRGGLAGCLPSMLKTWVRNWNSRLMFIPNQLAFCKGMKFWLALGTVWLKASHGLEPQKVADLDSVGGSAIQWQTSFPPKALSALFKRIFHPPPVIMKEGWQMDCCNGLLCKQHAFSRKLRVCIYRGLTWIFIVDEKSSRRATTGLLH